MIVKLLTEHHLEFPSLKGGCRGSSESTLVKTSNCWKSQALAQLLNFHTRKHPSTQLKLNHSQHTEPFPMLNLVDFRLPTIRIYC